MIPLLALLTAMVLLGIWMASTRGLLTELQSLCQHGWRDVSREMADRHEMVPSLVEMVRPHVANDKASTDALESLANASKGSAATEGGPTLIAVTENVVSGALRKVIEIADKQTKLLSDPTFQDLRSALVDQDDRIQRARRFYNTNVRDLNTRIKSFPASFVASMTGVTPLDSFDVGEALGTATPSLEELLESRASA